MYQVGIVEFTEVKTFSNAVTNKDIDLFILILVIQS